MGFQCEKCGSEAPFNELMAPDTITGKHLNLCGACRKRLTDRSLFIWLAAVAALAISLYLWRHYHPTVWLACFAWNMFLLQVVESLCTVPHELGHAMTARWMGFKVDRIIIGLGRRLGSFQFAGFQWDICARPFGGYVKFEQIAISNWRWRAVAVWAAGPLTNILLACGALVLLPSDAGKALDLGGTVSLWVLFIIANALMGLINLIPFVVNMPQLGLVPSDGMGLFQLVFQGKWPHATIPHIPAPSRAEPWWKCLIRLMAAIGMVIAGFFLLLLSAVVLFSGLSKEQMQFKAVFAGVVLLLVMIGVFWLAARILKSADGSSPDLQAASTGDGVLGQISPTDQAKDKWPDKISPPVMQFNLVQLYNTGEFAKAEEEVNTVLRQVPDNLWLQFFKASLLSAQTKNQEAEECLHAVFRRADIQSGTRISALHGRLLLLSQLGRKNEVKADVVSMLEGPYTVSEKTLLLDNLCCWPFMLERTEYLPEAEVWIKEAMKLDPASQTLRGTYAALLVESRQNPAEAEALLLKLLAQSKAPHDRGIASFYLALLAKRNGDLVAAKGWLRQAMQLYRAGWLLRRAEKEFSD